MLFRLSRLFLGILFLCFVSFCLVWWAVWSFFHLPSLPNSKCEMSYYHLAHSPLQVFDSSDPISPTFRIALDENRRVVHKAENSIRNKAIKRTKGLEKQKIFGLDQDDWPEEEEEEHQQHGRAKKEEANSKSSGSTVDSFFPSDSSSLFVRLNFSWLYSSISASHSAGYRLLRYHNYDANLSQFHSKAVLFLHGSSGHYHQARSVFSRINEMNMNEFGFDDFDYYSIDFNEEKAALSGQICYKQALFTNEVIKSILTHYESLNSLILVAHSMGAVLVSILPSLPNSTPQVISLIVTLGAPLSAPLLLFDDQLKEIYSNHIWVDQPGRNENEWNVISISGGLRDYHVDSSLSVIPSPNTSRNSPSHLRLSALSQAIPHVATSIDHQCLCWCKQLMEIIAHSIILFTSAQTSINYDPHSNAAKKTIQLIRDNFISPLSALQVHHSQSLWSSLDSSASVLASHSTRVQATVGDLQSATISLSIKKTSTRGQAEMMFILLHAEMDRIEVCEQPETESKENRYCIDITASIKSITNLYHPMSLPRVQVTSPSSNPSKISGLFTIHNFLYIPANSDPTSNYTHLVFTPTNSTKSAAKKYHDQHARVIIGSSLASPALLSSSYFLSSQHDLGVETGVYFYFSYIPAGVDRYLNVDVRMSDPSCLPFLHWSSVSADMENQNSTGPNDNMYEDQYLTSAGNHTVYYYRRPYSRYATCLILLPSPLSHRTSHSISISTSPLSFLHSIVPSFPLIPSILMALILFLLACQYESMRRSIENDAGNPTFPSYSALLSHPYAAFILFAFFILFTFWFTSTTYFSLAFNPSPIINQSETGVFSYIFSSFTSGHMNNNEIGVAGYVLTLALFCSLFVLDRILFLFFSGLSHIYSLMVVSLYNFISPISSWLVLFLYAYFTYVILIIQFTLLHYYMPFPATMAVLLNLLSPINEMIAWTLGTSFLSCITIEIETAIIGFIVINILVILSSANNNRQDRDSLAAHQRACFLLSLLSASLILPHSISSIPVAKDVTSNLGLHRSVDAGTGTGNGTLPNSEPQFALVLLYPFSLRYRNPLAVLSTFYIGIFTISSISLPVTITPYHGLIFSSYSLSLLFFFPPSSSLVALYSVLLIVILCFVPHAAALWIVNGQRMWRQLLPVQGQKGKQNVEMRVERNSNGQSDHDTLNQRNQGLKLRKRQTGDVVTK